MNSNKFANLFDSSDDSEKESISDEPIKFSRSYQTEQTDKNPSDKNPSFSVITEANLSLLNMSFGKVQICTPESEIIIQAKTKLLGSLVLALKNHVSKDFSQVYKSDSIFELLRGQPIYNFIREVAAGSEGSYQGSGLKLFQYRYFGTIINIVVIYSWGSCSYCDRDLALEHSLDGANKDVILMELEQDLRVKFNSFKFFLDFKEAVSYIKMNQMGIKIDFVQNPKKAEERRLKKEEIKRYGPNGKPKQLTFGDFVPKNLNHG